MRIWPFRRRRRASAAHDQPHEPSREQPPRSDVPKPAAAAPSNPKRTNTNNSNTRPSTKPPPSPPPPPRRSSRKGSQRRKRRASQHDNDIPAERPEAANPPLPPVTAQVKEAKNKQNLPAPPAHARNVSREDITALPFQARLDQSPHLRPVDLENRPHIPYNFRPQSISQISVQNQEATSTKPRRPNTLRSKRSTQDYSSPARRTSSRNSRRRDDALREEEIRLMSQPIPIPKRSGGDGPLRRDSKKFRGLLPKDSEVSLPPEGSFHSGMSGLLEQRGWEIGSLAVFNPRPAVRLSGTPQYVSSQSVPGQTSGMIYRIDSTRGQEQKPATEGGRKRRIVGDEADELDASDIRAIMERDAKRREQRHRDRQEKLDRKLKSREGRKRGDSDGRGQRDVEEQRRIDEGRARAQQQLQAQGPLTPPAAIHPALRSQESEIQPIGLGIGQARAPSPDAMDIDSARPASFPAHEHAPQGLETHQEEDDQQHPFSDAQEHLPSSPVAQHPQTMSHASHTVESPMEEPEVRTAQAVRMSLANTPPLSPVYGGSSSTLPEALRQQSISATSASDLPPPPPIPVERRSSDPPRERRSGAWAAFFRRGGTTKTRREGAVSPAETGFSNTSRESMRNQPLPAHLVGTDRPPAVRSRSGTPVRTQSKFREDLPEMPISPPESRQQSPDVPTSAAAVAAARRAGRSTPQPIDIPGRLRDSDRNDTPVSRSHTAMASSLASIDSEGSWLASGEKRQSKQSALGRSYSQRNANFSASFEELGGDKDAEYLTRNRESRLRKLSNPVLIGGYPEEASDEEDPLEQIDPEASEEPFAVHGSVRRKPTLVQRGPRLKSREGLVQEYASGEAGDTFKTPPEGSPDEEYEPESPIAQEDVHLEHARSVQYGSRHTRQFSAGSAKLLDVAPRRVSTDQGGPSKSPTPEPRSTAQSPTLE
ncbi:Hypothetical predicted protein [Lecanosticta acicola]|uniref:Uncharacterized protein n=1 Tax=Lecanosticta acicola TaxID=111012 RepID=A0AAI8YU41_9PEZI|nr:Hypothetical predicted protein [Lecanosticta acicola]